MPTGLLCPLGCIVGWTAVTYWLCDLLIGGVSGISVGQVFCDLLIGGVSGISVGQVFWPGTWAIDMVHFLLLYNKYHANKLHGYYVH